MSTVGQVWNLPVRFCMTWETIQMHTSANINTHLHMSTHTHGRLLFWLRSHTWDVTSHFNEREIKLLLRVKHIERMHLCLITHCPLPCFSNTLPFYIYLYIKKKIDYTVILLVQGKRLCWIHRGRKGKYLHPLLLSAWKEPFTKPQITTGSLWQHFHSVSLIRGSFWPDLMIF